MATTTTTNSAPVRAQSAPAGPKPVQNSAPSTPQTFEELFKVYAKFGDCKSVGDAITLSNSDKWFKQAKVIDGKKITTTDTGIAWKQIAKNKKTLTITEYNLFLETIAKSKKMEISDIKTKLSSSGAPATSHTTSALNSGAVARLTDHTKYTGSHKLRFDEEGKGRGKAGRVDIPSTTGYVSGYKEAGTFDKVHQ